MPRTLEDDLEALLTLLSEPERDQENEKPTMGALHTTTKKRSLKIPMLVFGGMCMLAVAAGASSAYLKKRALNSGPWLVHILRNKEGVRVLRDIGSVAQELRDATNSYVSSIPDVPGLREYALKALASEIDSYDKDLEGISHYWDPDFPSERIGQYMNRFSKLRQQAITQLNGLEGKKSNVSELSEPPGRAGSDKAAYSSQGESF